MEKYDIILAAERQFAREVALGVFVTRPLTVWHYLIPGMFIFDSLRRNSLIKQYLHQFIFPRKLALDAVVARTRAEDETAIQMRVEEDVRAWLNSLKLYSSNLHHAQLAAVDLLRDHYSKLLQAQGEVFGELVHDAYRRREHYQAFLERLTTAEDAVDQAIMDQAGDNQILGQRLRAEKEQVAKRRKKLLDEVF